MQSKRGRYTGIDPAEAVGNAYRRAYDDEGFEDIRGLLAIPDRFGSTYSNSLRHCSIGHSRYSRLANFYRRARYHDYHYDNDILSAPRCEPIYWMVASDDPSVWHWAYVAPVASCEFQHWRIYHQSGASDVRMDCAPKGGSQKRSRVFIVDRSELTVPVEISASAPVLRGDGRSGQGERDDAAGKDSGNTNNRVLSRKAASSPPLKPLMAPVCPSDLSADGRIVAKCNGHVRSGT